MMVDGSKYEILEEVANPKTHELNENIAEKQVYCKKHGIWCRFKTRLKFKKRSQGNSKETHLQKNFKKCGDKDLLISGESRESVVEQNEEFAYRGRVAHFSTIPDKYALLEEIETDSPTPSVQKFPLHVPQGDDRETNGEETLTQKEKNKTLKEYLAKKWRGKKAKRVRKGIRSGARSSVKYLESASSQMQTLFPDANTFVSATIQQNRQRYR